MEINTRLEGFEVIHAYTRAQAIEDGVLVDLSDLAREAGFRFPVAVTLGVWAVLNPTKELEARSPPGCLRCMYKLAYSFPHMGFKQGLGPHLNGSRLATSRF